MGLFEYFISDTYAGEKVYGNRYVGQSFTIGTVGTNVNHELSSITIKAYRVGDPGTVNLIVRAVDGFGHPTGAVLAAGNFEGESLTTDTDGEDVDVSLTPTTTLVAATQYAFYLTATDGNETNYIALRRTGN